MSITENSLYEAFGLKAPVQEPAAPAEPTPADPVREGVNEPGPADQVQDGTEPTDNPDDGVQTVQTAQDGLQEPEGNGTGEDGKPAQTEQQRRENAFRRRKAEEQARIDAAVQKARQEERDRSKAEMDAFFAGAKLKNTLTGEPITTMEQYRAWQEEFAADKLNRELAAGKLSPESLRKAIEDNPVVKQAQEIIRRSEAEQQTREQTAARERIQAELAEIGKIDPSIKEVKDLVAMPNFKEFQGYVNKGLSFKEAYFLVNRERMAQANAEAARQQAMNNARSKDHLAATAVQGAGAESVPRDVMAMYRMMMPKATEAQIQAHYNANKRK